MLRESLLAAIALAMGLAGGCAQQRALDVPSSSLVLGSLGTQAAWEHGRNDALLGSLPDESSGWHFLEIRHRENLRVSNGRPREFSTTITRSTKRHFFY